MRISYLLESVGKTGGNVVIFNHITAFAAAGHDIQVVTPYGCESWKDFSRKMDTTSRRVGYFGVWGGLKWFQVELRRLLPRFEAWFSRTIRGSPGVRAEFIRRRLIRFCPPSDIVIATHSLTSFAAADLPFSAICFYHMQGYEPWFSDDPEFAEIAEKSYNLPLLRIANCSWLAQKIESLGLPIAGIVAPGLNHSIFYSSEPLPCSVDKLVQPLKIVSYCDPRPLKGWHDSVVAMQNVFASLNGVMAIEWSVFGHGLSHECPVPVIHHGFLSHQALSELYRSADIVFIPSWFESFPLQPIEAMACGAAVVTTRIGTEDYAHNAETALVVEPRQPLILAEAILKLATDDVLRGRLAANGKLKSAEFTWERSARQLFDIVLPSTSSRH